MTEPRIVCRREKSCARSCLGLSTYTAATRFRRGSGRSAATPHGSNWWACLQLPTRPRVRCLNAQVLAACALGDENSTGLRDTAEVIYNCRVSELREGRPELC